MELEYTWFPQRMGFIRNTLRGTILIQRFKCDLVLGGTVGFELASTTNPIIVDLRARLCARQGLDGVTVPRACSARAGEAESLKLGVFGQSPPADWLLKHHLFDQSFLSTPVRRSRALSGEIIEKALRPARSMSLRMGTIAGYFAKSATSAPVASCRSSRTRRPVRLWHRDGRALRRSQWKDRIERLLDAQPPPHSSDPPAYGVPQLDDEGRIMTVRPILAHPRREPGK